MKKLTTDKIKLRLATKNDIQLLEYWDTKEHVIASGGVDDSYNWETEVRRKDDWQEILIAELNGKRIGVTVIIDPKLEETHYWGEIEPNMRALDIWIGEESDLGKGYGSQMMKQVLDRCFADLNVKAVIVDPLTSNTRAHKFYEKIGFEKVDTRKFGDDDCYVYRIERRVFKKIYENE